MIKAMTNLQNDSKTEMTIDNKASDTTIVKSSTTTQSNVEGQCGLQYAIKAAAQFKQDNNRFAHLKDEIIVDIGLTIPATFINQKLVTDPEYKVSASDKYYHQNCCSNTHMS